MILVNEYLRNIASIRLIRISNKPITEKYKFTMHTHFLIKIENIINL